MKETFLLLVEDHFDVADRGLAVAPSLSVRRDQAFPFTADVDVLAPTGERRSTVALFSVRMGGRSSKSVCEVILRSLGKSEVPIGSRILTDASTAARFLPGG